MTIKKLMLLSTVMALFMLCGTVTVCGQGQYEVDEFKTPGGKTVKIHALIHSSIRIEYNGQEIEIDPVSKLGNRTTDYAAFPKADYILVTHEHGDHFDKSVLHLMI